MNNLKAKLQQLEKQAANIKQENAQLVAEKKYFIKTIASLKLDLEDLEATKEQLAEERYRLEMLLSKKDTQYLQVNSLKYMLRCQCELY